MATPIRADARASELADDTRVGAAPGTSWGWRAAVLAVTLVALGLRLHELGAQSLWYDEGVSAAMTRRPLLDIPAAAAGDVHPPLYYLLLHLWAVPFGASEWSLRLLSAFAGTLTVPLLYRIGARIALPSIGLAAAVLLAALPVHIYYSQETRMYALAALLVTGAAAGMAEWATGHRPGLKPRAEAAKPHAWGWEAEVGADSSQPASAGFATSARGFSPGSRPGSRFAHSSARSLTDLLPLPLLAYAACALGAAYSHYFAGVAVAAVAVWGLLVRPGGWRSWLGCHVAMLLCYLPWLALVRLANLEARRQESSLGAAALAERAWRELLVGPFWLPPSWLMLALGALAAVGAVSALNGRRRMVPLFWLVVPVAVLVAISLGRSYYQLRFLVPATPGLALLLGFGCDPLAWPGPRRFYAFRGIVALAVGVAVVMAWWPAVSGLWLDPAQQRDDYRGLAAFVAARAAPGDAIVLCAPGQQEVFGYYDRSGLPTFGLPAWPRAPREATEAALHDVSARYSRLWVVYWAEREADPGDIVQGWLDRSAWKSLDRWFGGPRLALYETRGSAPLRSVGATFGESIRLESVALGEARTPSGGVVPLTLTWRAIAPVGTRYTVFAHLLDAQELLYGGRDAEPAGGMRPTTGWTVGGTIEDRLGVPILDGTPPGRYALEIGLYDAASGARLPIRGADGALVGDRLIVGEVAVAPPPPGAVTPVPTRAVDRAVGGLNLAGYGLTLVGEDQQRERLPRSETAQLNLFWRRGSSAAAVQPLTMRLLDASGTAKLTRSLQPGGSEYPPTAWPVDGVVREQVRLPLGDLAPGSYQLAVTPAEGTPLELTTLVVEE